MCIYNAGISFVCDFSRRPRYYVIAMPAAHVHAHTHPAPDCCPEVLSNTVMDVKYSRNVGDWEQS